MNIIDRLLKKEEPAVSEMEQETREKLEGRIVKLGEGWGFISSKDIPYERIFFHWSALQQDTLRFPELHKGMIVEFEPLKIEGRGLRAIRIRVIDEDK